MKKLFSHLLALAVILCIPSAQAQSPYVSILDIRDETPELWQESYTTNKGESIAINALLRIPPVDKVPIVRVGWYEASGILDALVEIGESTPLVTTLSKNVPSTHRYTLLETGEAVNGFCPWEKAPTAFMALFHGLFSEYADVELQLGSLLAFSPPQGTASQDVYQVLCYQSFHGIPFLVRSGFRYPPKELVDIPGNSVYGVLENADTFHVSVSLSRELGIDADDVPLLPFSEIKKVFEERIRGGFVARLDEVRFGYMLFFDENKMGQEYVLAPVWAAVGEVRGDLKIPFNRERNRETEFLKFGNLNKIVVNAQTGEIYQFDTDKRKDRQFMPVIIPW